MNRKILTYHFINAEKYKPGSVSKFIKNINNKQTTVCFDLEDTINTDFDRIHKENIIKFIKEANGRNLKVRFGVRINNVRTKIFPRDLTFLKLFNKYSAIDCVFIPKVKGLKDIETAINNLQKQNIRYTEVIPIIETKAGLENVIKKSVLSSNLFNKIAFGHSDFNLDNGFFPFYHQNTAVYWKWVCKILLTAEPYGKTFINSPLLFLDDDTLFSTMLAKLDSLCKNKFGQTSLTLHQTKLCRETNSISKLPRATNRGSKKSFALYITSGYKKHNIDNKLFAIDPVNQYLISPQEFKAAKNYLAHHEKS